MVICPVALAVGCKKCPVFSVCPATRLIGDQKPAEKTSEAAADEPSTKAKRTRHRRRR